MALDPSLPTPLTLKWEKRKTASSTHTPTARAGCTMGLWSAKGTGVMFGGVTDEDRGEEGLESVFWNDLCVFFCRRTCDEHERGTDVLFWGDGRYGYQLGGHGRWIAMHLKKPKKRGGGRKKQVKGGEVVPPAHGLDDHEEDPGDDGEETEASAGHAFAPIAHSALIAD